MRSSSERRLESLEALYAKLLLSALQRCAKGQWGLFGHNDTAIDKSGAGLRSRLRDPSVNELLELGAKIEGLRHSLGYANAFPLHERLVRMRAGHDANTPGEPNIAQQWLDEMLPPNDKMC